MRNSKVIQQYFDAFYVMTQYCLINWFNSASGLLYYTIVVIILGIIVAYIF